MARRLVRSLAKNLGEVIGVAVCVVAVVGAVVVVRHSGADSPPASSASLRGLPKTKEFTREQCLRVPHTAWTREQVLSALGRPRFYEPGDDALPYQLAGGNDLETCTLWFDLDDRLRGVTMDVWSADHL